MLRGVMLWVAVCCAGSLWAQENNDSNTVDFFPGELTNVHWVFSGVVRNEAGELFGYFFQMQRQGDMLDAKAALFDHQNRVVVSEEGHARMTASKSTRWMAGRLFLRFNPINDSWVFGFKTKEKQGFNFKVDMLGQLEQKLETKTLHSGVKLMVTPTGQLSGDVRMSKTQRDEFVTARKTWFRQLWLTHASEEPYQFSGLLCQLNQGKELYFVKMAHETALQGAIAGLMDAQGMSSPVSQFVDMSEDGEGRWHVNVPSPKAHWVLQAPQKQEAWVAGFTSEIPVDNGLPGFCFWNQDVLGAKENVGNV